MLVVEPVAVCRGFDAVQRSADIGPYSRICQVLTILVLQGNAILPKREPVNSVAVSLSMTLLSLRHSFACPKIPISHQKRLWFAVLLGGFSVERPVSLSSSNACAFAVACSHGATIKLRRPRQDWAQIGVSAKFTGESRRIVFMDASLSMRGSDHE